MFQTLNTHRLSLKFKGGFMIKLLAYSALFLFSFNVYSYPHDCISTNDTRVVIGASWWETIETLSIINSNYQIKAWCNDVVPDSCSKNIDCELNYSCFDIKRELDVTVNVSYEDDMSYRIHSVYINEKLIDQDFSCNSN